MDAISALGLALGYLIGSIPFTQIIAKKVKNVDLRSVGSKNVGARNTTKNVGLGWGIFAGALDIFKSYAAISIAQSIGVYDPYHIWAGLAAIAGHNWPIWLRFRGGKGLGAMMGVGLWIAPIEASITFIVSMAILVFTKNIFYTTFGGFGTMIGLTYLRLNPENVIPYLLAGFSIIMLASFPVALETIKISGGIIGYFKNPNQMYEENDPNLK